MLLCIILRGTFSLSSQDFLEMHGEDNIKTTSPMLMNAASKINVF
jgi:hypothetical protein